MEITLSSLSISNLHDVILLLHYFKEAKFMKNLFSSSTTFVYDADWNSLQYIVIRIGSIITDYSI